MSREMFPKTPALLSRGGTDTLYFMPEVHPAVPQVGDGMLACVTKNAIALVPRTPLQPAVEAQR